MNILKLSLYLGVDKIKPKKGKRPLSKRCSIQDGSIYRRICVVQSEKFMSIENAAFERKQKLFYAFIRINHLLFLMHII